MRSCWVSARSCWLSARSRSVLSWFAICSTARVSSANWPATLAMSSWAVIAAGFYAGSQLIHARRIQFTRDRFQGSTMVRLALRARTPAEAQTTSTRFARETWDLGKQSSTCRASSLCTERLAPQHRQFRAFLARARLRPLLLPLRKRCQPVALPHSTTLGVNSARRANRRGNPPIGVTSNRDRSRRGRCPFGWTSRAWFSLRATRPASRPSAPSREAKSGAAGSRPHAAASSTHACVRTRRRALGVSQRAHRTVASRLTPRRVSPRAVKEVIQRHSRLLSG